MNKTIWILLSVAVVAVAVVAVYFVFPQQSGEPSEVVSTTPPAPSQIPSPVAVSDDPDVVIAEIIQAAEQEILTPEETYPTLVADSSQVIDGFDQSSNPDQF